MHQNTSRFQSPPVRCAAALVILLAFATSCSRSRERPLFKLLTASETGVDFANTIVESDSLNVQTDVYIYNGAGVAVGDIDNDGLPDIFFSGNVVSSRLYRNEGGMRFHDITTAAGVSTSRWATGAAMADVNGDGLLDIYVSVSGPEKLKSEDRANLLFINNGHGTFTESASKYGVADTGFTTQAAFLDYNRDGCLDLFLLNNSPKDFTRGVTNLPMMGGDATPGSHNQLYRNDCPAGRPGRFTNVSAKAGIARDVGYGLGVAVSDLNGDGWPDIYVSNDGIPNDVVYINNRDGTFTNRAAEVLKHTSQAGMGVDIADFNNDGRPDILQVDMLPAALQRRKRTLGTTSPGALEDVRHRGFRDDYIQNSLQLNNGVLPDGNPVFSEISRLAGVSRTDWSWSALFADFDNDGNKDLFIGNGYPKAVNDLDYLATANGMQRRGNIAAVRKLLRQLPAYDVSNYFFVNNGDLTFSDQTKAWGLERPSFSYGAAYADLDNDGRLDLVVNNIDAPAFIYHNVQTVDDAHHFLRIKLEGDSGNRRGIGASVVLTAGGRKQYLYQSPYRGFMSTVDDRLHFGLGATRQIDSLEIVWPSGRYQALMHPAVDRELVLRYSAASEKRSFIPALAGAGSLEFQPVDARKGLTYQQAREIPLDYGVQPLLPYNLSSRGPMVAVGDVNGDGLDDVFIGGGAGSAREILIQKKDGSFAADSQPDPWVTDKDYEDWGALFFDANGDGRPDLYVASGGFQLTPGSPLLQDRLYINKGGRFVRDSAALPVMLTITGTVRAGDFNGDGRPDLFVGGRLTPRRYPLPTRSYILRNDGGHFTDVTATVAPELIKPGGLVTDAQWLDFDGDGRLDLVTTGEWMSVEFYRNEGGHFRNVTKSTGLPPLRGWWSSLAAADFDRDGRPDLVAGNLGLNYSYTTGSNSKFGIYAGDFTGEGKTDVVLSQEIDGKEYPYAGIAQLADAMYTLGIRFPTFGSFANATMNDAFGEVALKRALHYEVDTFASTFLHNDGGGKFSAAALPNLAQISPIKAIVAQDVDGDGNVDLIVAGNMYDAEPNTPRADAGHGLWLKGDGRGHFVPVPMWQSGLLAPANVTGLATVKTASGKVLIVANSGDSVQAFTMMRR